MMGIGSSVAPWSQAYCLWRSGWRFHWISFQWYLSPTFTVWARPQWLHLSWSRIPPCCASIPSEPSGVTIMMDNKALLTSADEAWISGVLHTPTMLLLRDVVGCEGGTWFNSLSAISLSAISISAISLPAMSLSAISLSALLHLVYLQFACLRISLFSIRLSAIRISHESYSSSLGCLGRQPH